MRHPISVVRSARAVADPLFAARGTWRFVADVGVADWVPASFAARWGDLSRDAKVLLWWVCFNLLAEAQLLLDSSGGVPAAAAVFRMEDVFERGDVAPLQRILRAMARAVGGSRGERAAAAGGGGGDHGGGADDDDDDDEHDDEYDDDAHDWAHVSRLATSEGARHNRHASSAQERVTWPQLQSAAEMAPRPDVRPFERAVVRVAMHMCTRFGYSECGGDWPPCRGAKARK